MAPYSKTHQLSYYFTIILIISVQRGLKGDPFDEDMLKDGEKVDNEVQRSLFNKSSGLLVLSQQTEQFSVRYKTRGTY